MQVALQHPHSACKRFAAPSSSFAFSSAWSSGSPQSSSRSLPSAGMCAWAGKGSEIRYLKCNLGLVPE